GPNFILSHANGTLANPVVTASGDELGTLRFRGYNGSLSAGVGAEIYSFADAEWATAGDTTDSPGRLSFFTTPDGANADIERLTIKNDGNVGIGSTTPITKFQVHRGDTTRTDVSISNIDKVAAEEVG